jgi:PLAC8 family
MREQSPKTSKCGGSIHYIWHPSTWCAICCTQLGVGQIMSRMQYSWLGEPTGGNTFVSSRTWTVVVTLVVSFFVYSTCLEIAEAVYNDDYGIGTDTSGWIQVSRFIGNILFCFWAVYSLCRTRENIRAQYRIPETYKDLKGCEDLCCAIWCAPCVTAQMLRHTGDYEHYPGMCCTSTGHVQPTTPSIV